MTQEYWKQKVEALRESDMWGYLSSESYGVVSWIPTKNADTDKNQGMDVLDIEIIIQYKATCNLSTLWQRFGWVAHKQGMEATVILLVEKNKIVSEEVGPTGNKRKAMKALTPTQAKQVASMPSMRSPASKTPDNPVVDDPSSIDDPSQHVNMQLTEEERVQQKKDEYMKADHTIMNVTQS